MTFLELNGAVIHHDIRRGTGPSVVFLNSLGTDLRIWDDVVRALPAEWMILRMDKRGHGLSQAADADMNTYAADAAALMDRYGITSSIVCGVSIGGMIAQQLFHARPDLVSAMVLSNTAARIGDAESWQARLDQLDEVGLENMADGILERWFSEGFRRDRPAELEGYHAMLSRTPSDGYAAACRAIRDTDLRTKSPEIDVPVTCIAGSDDLATPPDLVADFARSMPRASLIEIPGAGHLPCIEAPERLAEQIATLGRS